MVNSNIYFTLDSATKIDDLNSRIRHVWPPGMNYGLDFHSILISDYNECGTHWDDCHRRAQCHNMEGLYSCRCDDGYFDQSRVLLLPAGRICKNTTTEEIETRPTDPPLPRDEQEARDRLENEAMDIKRNLGIENDIYKEMLSESSLNSLGQAGIHKGMLAYAPKENLPGEWTDGIEWPGPTGVSIKTTGPKSLQLAWRKIDHDQWGNRFFYIISFRNAIPESTPDEGWQDWPIGSSSSTIELDGFTPNRRYEVSHIFENLGQG